MKEKRFAIRIEETIGRTIIVTAETLEEAIEAVEDGVNTNRIILDTVEDFTGREVGPSECFPGGIVPEDRDVSYYDSYVVRR